MKYLIYHKNYLFILMFLAVHTAVFSQKKSRACISKEEMDVLVARIELKREEWVKKGILKPRNARPAVYNHDFIWPLRKADNYNQPNTYYISKYVDLDNGYNNQLEDYNCGTRTYDTEDYNHSGIDIALGPYPWRMMDDKNVEVVAAEGGVIVDKHVGEPDRNCDGFEDPITYYGNYIAIEHSDGVTTYYLHMKGGSVTSKIIGQSVSTGEF